MRLVQVMVPAGKREAVLGVLDDEGIDYVLADETSGRDYVAVAWFPLPSSALEPVLERLREAGLERDAYTVVLEAETVVSRRFESLVDRYEEAEDTDRIAREELAARAADLAPRWTTYLIMTVVSAVVATAGLLLDSPAVVVGSMVIAPLIGPAMATSVGTVLADGDLFAKGVRMQVVGAVLAVASAAGFAALLRHGHVVPLGATEVFAIPEIEERLSPDVLSLAVALGAGVAGALSLSSGVSASLVGVMIAVALVPPTAVVGIGLAWGRPAAAVGPAVLLAVNFASINGAAMAVLWRKGYRPDQWFRAESARAETLKRLAALAGALLVLSAFLGGVTYGSYRSAQFEDHARGAVESAVADDPAVSLVSFRVEYGEGVPVRRPERVVVVLGHPPGTDPPLLAAELAARIAAFDGGPFAEELGLGGEVPVEVRYVTVERAGG